tara:strand:- start:1790 stop:2827 length:1038 start_codon:yes stop_codon:yes gene_type:complete
MTKLLFVDNGIEFDSTLVREKPFGGAEVAFVSLVEELAKLNFEVKIFNNCVNQGLINSVNWKKLDASIEEEKFDVLIVNRGDKFLNFRKECQRRVFWIHNPASYLLKFRYLSKLFMNNFKIVFSSYYHKRTYPFWAPAKEKVVIPYGVDNFLFQKSRIRTPPDPEAIFTSNPLRGLNWLLDQWEFKIFPNVKNAKLFLFTGADTYGKFGKKHFKKISMVLSRADSLKKKGVILNKPLKRMKLFNRIRESRIFLYQGSDDETFCMSLAESQMLGVPAVVCNYGCMDERIISNRTGYVCDTEDEFCKNTIRLLSENELWSKMHRDLLQRKNHFTWQQIAKRWKKILN